MNMGSTGVSPAFFGNKAFSSASRRDGGAPRIEKN
jgi:hypothetical protein